MEEYLFYIAEPRGLPPPVCPTGYQWRLWRPSLRHVIPPGLPCFPFLVWWLLHHLRIFANRGYRVLLVTCGGELVHRSVLTPRYFRFPFMSVSALQIGDTWTDDTHRGKGLAGFAARQLIAMGESRNYWYLTEKSNTASIRVAEKSGFTLAGSGRRTSRFGARALGSYVIQCRVVPTV